jgi:hypothetical protein
VYKKSHRKAIRGKRLLAAEKKRFGETVQEKVGF